MSDKNLRKAKEESSRENTTTKKAMAKCISSSNPIEFRMDYKSPEADKLRDAVAKKLLDFLGDYTDNVLADYIVVLVSNGKNQTQAQEDLEDFLGEDSERFVAWLWHYLSKENHIPRITVDSSNLKAVVTRKRDVSYTENNSSSLTDTNVHSHSEEMSDVPMYKDGRYDSSSYSTNSKSSNATGIPESLQRWCPSLNGIEVDNKKLQTLLNKVDSEGLPTKSMLVNIDSTTVPYTGATKHFSSIVKKSLEIPSGDEQLHYEYDREKIAKTDSSAMLQQSLPVGHVPRAEQVSRGLRSVITEDHQLRPRPVRSSSKARMQLAAMDSTPHNTARPRGNVWDRLGKPCNEDNAEMRGENSQNDGNLIKRELLKRELLFSQGKECQNPRSLWVKQHAPLSRTMVAGTFALDNSSCQVMSNNNHANGSRKLECGSDIVANVSHVNNFKRKRLSSESNAGNSSASFSGQGSVPTKFDRSQSLKESVPEAKLSSRLFSRSASVDRISQADNVNTVISTGVDRDLQLDKISSSQLNMSAVLSTRRQKSVPDNSQVPAKSESPIKSEGLVADRKPVKEEVLDVKSRLRQIEMDMLKLRSKQAEIKNDLNPNGLAGVQNHSDEDIASRTVLVTNVHFAATREALLSHFTKCGAVIKIVMLNDTITGQPKGAAYIVFANKDSVDRAVSMSGTSFFSRILTVIRKADMPSDFLVPPQSTAKLVQPFHTQPYWKAPTQRSYASTHLQWRRENPDTGRESISAATNGLDSLST